jgi:methionyl-tRNA formyltransferase
VRVAFLGTPRFAVPALEAALAASDVQAVVTRPDRPKGRGLRVEPTAVATAAAQYGLEVLQPLSLRDHAFLRRLRELAPDILVAVAFGRLIPPDVLGVAPLGGINLHPSLLPRYRGAAPIPRAIAAGDTETGVTILHISEDLDAGDIILQRAVRIAPEDTTRTLEPRLARAGADLLVEALRLLEAGKAPRRSQDPTQATLAPKLSRAEGLIRWSEPAQRIVNLVRAFDPWPVAYTLRDGEELRLWRATALDNAPTLPGILPEPGTVLRAAAQEGEPLVVAAGEGSVAIHEVQPPSGRRMSAAAYLRGHPLAPGTVLGGPHRSPSSLPRR